MTGEEENTQGTNVLRSAASGLSMQVGLKFGTKLLQLVLNFAVIRAIEPELFGLTVYFSTLVTF